MAQTRAPMPPSRRAKIFGMFDALKGLREALAAKEKQPQPRRLLAPDAIAQIDETLRQLIPGDLVTVVYYSGFEQCYCQLTGRLKRLEACWQYLQVGQVCIDFADIYQILA